MTKPDAIHRIGSFVFDTGKSQLSDPNGAPVSLRPQTQSVLKHLVLAQGKLVSKVHLMEKVWPDTHVTDDSLVQCISEIRKALGTEESKLVITVPKRGYKLATSGQSAGRPARKPIGSLLFPVLTGLALILIFAVVSLFSSSPKPLASQAPQSLAVLPFENMSGDAAQAYLSDGMTEDLIVSLSQISDLRVISRAASSAIAELTADPRKIAQDLGVSHLVAGSVRRVEGRLRLTTSLIDGTTGESLWANTYEGPSDEIFTVQDDALNDLVRTLAVRLSPSERERLGVRGTRNAQAYDLYLQGLALQNFLTRTANYDSEDAFAAAIRMDPNYAAAHAHMSLTLSMRAEYTWTEDTEGTIERAVEFGNRAVELDPNLPFARFALGRLLSRKFISDLPASIAEFDKAIELDPNYADAYAFKANVLTFGGDAEAALPVIKMAFAKNPVPPYWYNIPVGLSHFYLGNNDAAAEAFQSVLDRNANSPHALRFLIATYGRQGNTDDAEWFAMEYEALGHSATVEDMLLFASPRDPDYRAYLAESLRMAGIPD